MIDFSLNEEQRLLKETARGFAEKEIKPLVKKIEEIDKAKHTPWELCREMFRKATKLGFTKLLIPEKYGGLGRGCIDVVLLCEELGAADVAIASDIFSETITIPLIVMIGGNEEQRERLLGEFCSAEDHVLAGAQSEPNVAGSELFCPIPDPKLGLKTFARREGEGYVLNGTKSAFITNAGAAKSYFILARTDLTKPAFESLSIFYIPAATPGFTVGKKTELIGYKTSQHAEVVLENVFVPKENLIGKEGEALSIMSKLPHMGIALAACFVGLARAAFEYALDYAKQRVSW
jgi:alkylation response protein AidB-like acyl-CoA dehydrogenase